PVPSVTAVRVFSIKTGLLASIVTPGNTAPDESFTTPDRVDCWALTDAGRINSHDSTNTICRKDSILPPSFRRILTLLGRKTRKKPAPRKPAIQLSNGQRLHMCGAVP